MRLWHLIVFVLLLVVFAAMLTPISVLAPSTPGGFSYARADGSPIEARFSDAKIGQMKLGMVHWRAQPEALLRGEIGGKLALSSGAVVGDGEIAVGLNDSVRLQAPKLAMKPLFPLGADGGGLGEAVLSNFAVAFAGGRCTQAQGDASAELDSGLSKGLAFPAPSLFGRAACVGEDAQIRMTGEEDGVSMDVVVTASPNGAGRWRLMMSSENPTVLAGAQLLGLGSVGADGRLAKEGAFRWRP